MVRRPGAFRVWSRNSSISVVRFSPKTCPWLSIGLADWWKVHLNVKCTVCSVFGPCPPLLKCDSFGCCISWNFHRRCQVKHDTTILEYLIFCINHIHIHMLSCVGQCLKFLIYALLETVSCLDFVERMAIADQVLGLLYFVIGCMKEWIHRLSQRGLAAFHAKGVLASECHDSGILASGYRGLLSCSKLHLGGPIAWAGAAEHRIGSPWWLIINSQIKKKKRFIIWLVGLLVFVAGLKIVRFWNLIFVSPPCLLLELNIQ